jgi:hypothetical protein
MAAASAILPGDDEEGIALEQPRKRRKEDVVRAAVLPAAAVAVQGVEVRNVHTGTAGAAARSSDAADVDMEGIELPREYFFGDPPAAGDSDGAPAIASMNEDGGAPGAAAAATAATTGTATSGETVQQLQAALKSSERRYRESLKRMREHDQYMENVKNGCKCRICLNPAQVLTMMPCGEHGTCWVCLVKHACSRMAFEEDDTIELGGRLVCKAVCPVCRSPGKPPLNDQLDSDVAPLPPSDLRDFHYAFLKRPLVACPYCEIAVKPNQTDEHVRRCSERKHPCPRDGCRKMYRPSKGYEHHLRHECTGYRCASCRETSLTLEEYVRHQRQHAKTNEMGRQMSDSLVEIYTLLRRRLPYMRMDHVEQMQVFLQSLRTLLAVGNDRTFQSGAKQLARCGTGLADLFAAAQDPQMLSSWLEQAQQTSTLAHGTGDAPPDAPILCRIVDLPASTGGDQHRPTMSSMASSHGDT